MRIPGQTRCTLCMMRRVTVEQKRTKNGSFASTGGFGSDPLSFKRRTHLRHTGYMLAAATHMTTEPRGSRPGSQRLQPRHRRRRHPQHLGDEGLRRRRRRQNRRGLPRHGRQPAEKIGYLPEVDSLFFMRCLGAYAFNLSNFALTFALNSSSLALRSALRSAFICACAWL